MSSANPQQYHHFVIKTNRTIIGSNGQKYKIPLITVNSTGQPHKYTRSKGHAESLDAVEYFTQKMITNDALSSAPVGIYTWIIVGDDFYATKVVSKQEIGTMHRDLYRFSASKTHNQTDIIAAGELEIKIEQGVKKIEFNFLSGTYYKRFIPGNVGIEAFISELADKVIDKIKSFGIEHAVYVYDKNLIDTANFKASPKSIAELNKRFNKGGKRRTKRNKTKKRK